MNYFIDFEATQFSEEIISVGCIREDGETFYALVAPVEGKITPFITNLTGITKEMLKDALSPDRVFELFYDWMFADSTDTPEFFVWGNSDKNFIRHTCHRTNSVKARIALGYIGASMKDYGRICKKNLKWGSEHGLLKTLQKFEIDAEQNHNSLDDAIMLKKVYDYMHMTSEDKLAELFLTWLKTPKVETKKEIVETPEIKLEDLEDGTIYFKNKKKIVASFKNVDDAVSWIKETKVGKDTDAYNNFNVDLTRKKIMHSCNHGSTYYCIRWFIVKKGE